MVQLTGRDPPGDSIAPVPLEDSFRPPEILPAHATLSRVDVRPKGEHRLQQVLGVPAEGACEGYRRQRPALSEPSPKQHPPQSVGSTLLPHGTHRAPLHVPGRGERRRRELESRFLRSPVEVDLLVPGRERFVETPDGIPDGPLHAPAGPMRIGQVSHRPVFRAELPAGVGLHPGAHQICLIEGSCHHTDPVSTHAIISVAEQDLRSGRNRDSRVAGMGGPLGLVSPDHPQVPGDAIGPSQRRFPCPIRGEVVRDDDVECRRVDLLRQRFQLPPDAVGGIEGGDDHGDVCGMAHDALPVGLERSG